MAHFSKVFGFSTDLESWSYNEIGNATGAREVTGGVDNGPCISVTNNGRNKIDTQSYWQWSGTFEDLGLDAGSTITGYSSSSYSWACATFLVVDTLTTGVMTLNDGTARSLAPDVNVTGTTSHATNSQSGTITGLSLASTTSITITIPVNADNGNSATASGILDYDNITIGVDYTEGGGFVPAWAGGNIGRLL